MTTRRLTVDRDRCVGHGLCFGTAPDLFDCDDEGFPVVLKDALPDRSTAEADYAVENCPTRAIALVKRD